MKSRVIQLQVKTKQKFAQFGRPDVLSKPTIMSAS
jgi:hypothetical protein